MIKLNVKITQQDYIKMTLTRFLKRPSIIILFIFFSINIIISFWGNSKIDPMYIYVFGGYMLGMPLLIVYSARKTYNTNKDLQGEVAWTISEESLKLKGNAFESEFEWSSIYYIKKSEKYILLFKDRIVANIISIDSFESENDLARFWEFAKKNNIKIK